MFSRYGSLLVAVGVFCGFFLVGLGTTYQGYVLKFTSQPRSIIEAEGKNASFSCKAVSIVGPVTYKWLVNESTLLPSSNKNHLTSTGITITNLQRHVDNGVYRCIAVNDIGSILSEKATLQVAYFDILDSNQTITHEVKQFESIILQAPRVLSVPPARHVWKLSGNVIEDGYTSKIFISSNGDLSVVGPEKRSYEFTCIAQNPITKRELRKRHILRTKGCFTEEKDISFLKTPTDKIIDAGSPMVVFECITDVLHKNNSAGIILPLPVEIRWYKDLDELSVDGSSKYGYLKNTTSLKRKLVVYEPDRDDEGEYYCSVTNLRLKLIKSPNASLTVRDPPPKFAKQLPPSITRWPGQKIKIKCPHWNDSEDEDEDEDDNEDNIPCIWYKDAQQLVPDGTRVIVKDGYLMITRANTSDTGFYQIVIRNNGGEVIGNAIYLEIKDNASSSTRPSQSKTRSPTLTSALYSRSISTASSSTSIASSETPHSTYTTQLTTALTSTLSPSAITTTKRLLTSTALQTKQARTSSATTFSTTATSTLPLEPTPTVKSQEIFAPSITQTTAIRNQTIVEPATGLTTGAGGLDTTERTTMKIGVDVDSRKKSVNDGEKDLLIWISAAVGGFIILSVAVVTVVYCCAKSKRPRKQSFKLKQEKYDELELNSLPRRGQGTGRYQSVIDKSSPRNIPGIDTKRLLTDDDDHLYAPVTALDNIAADLKNNESLAQGPVYAEPFKNTNRKPYLHPLPSTPAPNADNFKERPDSMHSYLELLGPDDVSRDVYAEPKEGKLNDFVKNAVKPNECIYDCAREGVLTNTLRRIIKQQEDNVENDEKIPVYHVLEDEPTQTGLKRESSLYANPEDIVTGVLQPSSNDGLSISEPLYHVLESLDNFSNSKADTGDMYDYYKAEGTIKRESMYQPLANIADNIYQPLNAKARGPSAPNSGHHTNDYGNSFNGNSTRDSRSLTDPKRLSNYSDNSEDLYQPLNNSERCPLDVSKPRGSFSKLRNSKRDSILSTGEGSSSASSSYREPTLHAVDLSPSGSLKEPKTFRPGHRRNRSDTHIIVNISNLNRRRASVQGPEISSTNAEQPQFRHKRNLSDAGLCPVNLSQLRVSIDLDSPMQGDDSNSLYMPLIKTGVN